MGDESPPKAPVYAPFSEYYLHPSEGAVWSRSILLKADNYEEWSRSLRNNLRAKNKLGFIDVIADERKQTVSEAQEHPRSDVVGFAANGAAHTRSSRSVGSVEGRVCSHYGRAGHEKDKCFELVGFPEWCAGGSRGGRGGRSGRGGSGSRGGRSGGRSFASNVGSSKGQGVQEIGTDDRASAPTLSDDQWAQFLAAISRSKPPSSSTEKLNGV
ncbi:hypothetical protein SOVF_059310 [Spinacia oleracea]|nr:hypothetical protein SOVF_059310 [Spinacia oleracea]